MKNNGIKISFEDAIKISNIEKNLLKRRENNFLLSDYQIGILQRNGINYLKYSSIKDLLFDMEDILNDDFDEELDIVSSQIAEFLYYNETKK